MVSGGLAGLREMDWERERDNLEGVEGNEEERDVKERDDFGGFLKKEKKNERSAVRSEYKSN